MQVEIYLAINEDGEYEVGLEVDEACERLADNYGGAQRRVVRLLVEVTEPETVEVEVNVPDEANANAVTVEVPVQAGPATPSQS